MNSNFIFIILIISIISSILKKYVPEFFTPFNILSISFILLFLISHISNVITELNNILNLSRISNDDRCTILKILGIYLITQFSSDTCKDSGYQSFANAINIFGKISIVLTSMQMFKNFFSFISDIINRVSI